MGRPRKVEPFKLCKACRALLVRRRFGAVLEDLGVFTRRVYCGTACMAKGYRKAHPKTVSAYRGRAAKHKGTACEVCQRTDRLHAHHVDKDVTNNTPSNIQTLCASCHISYHHRQRRLGLPIGRMECPA
jgi:hypothetical protein